MTKVAAVSKAMRRLPVLDRIELLYELRSSVAADQRDIPVSKAQKTMIRERLAEIDEHPDRLMSEAELDREIQQALRRFGAGRRRKKAA
jgi:putative addiction module component (TIGR02574 family)